MENHNPTLQDVAKHAGVSNATVSRVINKTGYVSPHLRSRVDDALKELNYSLNVAARTLRTSMSHTLGFIATDLLDPFIPALATGIEAVASQRGYSTLFATTRAEVRVETDCIEMLRQNRADGLIIASILEGNNTVGRLQAQGYPFILISRHLPNLFTNYVGAENHNGALQVICYLHSLGHTRIGYISGDPRSSATVERLAGYRDGLEQGQIRVDEEIIVQGTYDANSGYVATEKLLSLKTPPTAIFSANDTMAFGAWRALYDHGLRVPEDMSLVGFDDIEYSSSGPILFTTVHVPKKKMGMRAAEILIQEIESGKSSSPVQEILPVKLIVRDTCSSPRKKLIN